MFVCFHQAGILYKVHSHLLPCVPFDMTGKLLSFFTACMLVTIISVRHKRWRSFYIASHLYGRLPVNSIYIIYVRIILFTLCTVLSSGRCFWLCRLPCTTIYDYMLWSYIILEPSQAQTDRHDTQWCVIFCSCSVITCGFRLNVTVPEGSPAVLQIVCDQALDTDITDITFSVTTMDNSASCEWEVFLHGNKLHVCYIEHLFISPSLSSQWLPGWHFQCHHSSW